MGRISEFGQHLYSGRVSFNFVGRRLLWYGLSGFIVVACVAAFWFRGFHYDIEFRGGVEFTAQVKTADARAVDRLTDVVRSVPGTGDPLVNTSGDSGIRIQTGALSQSQATQVEKALKAAGVTEVSQDLIGPSW